MKRLNFLAAICFVAGISFATSSCNSREEKKADEQPAESGSVTAPEPTAAKPVYMMVMTHKVKNYAKWQAGYEAGDSMRLAFGLHSDVLARGVKDSNMVMIAGKIDDVTRAKEFTNLADLKAAMQNAGVMGTPATSYLDMQMLDTTPNTTSMRLMITHKVKDWDAWKKAFDSHKQERTDAGFADRAIGYEVGNNHQVTIVLLVTDMKKAEDFVKSEDLKKKMEEAGVDGPPVFFYYNVVKKY